MNSQPNVTKRSFVGYEAVCCFHSWKCGLDSSAEGIDFTAGKKWLFYGRVEDLYEPYGSNDWHCHAVEVVDITGRDEHVRRQTAMLRLEGANLTVDVGEDVQAV